MRARIPVAVTVDDNLVRGRVPVAMGVYGDSVTARIPLAAEVDPFAGTGVHRPRSRR